MAVRTIQSQESPHFPQIKKKT